MTKHLVLTWSDQYFVPQHLQTVPSSLWELGEPSRVPHQTLFGALYDYILVFRCDLLFRSSITDNFVFLLPKNFVQNSIRGCWYSEWNNLNAVHLISTTLHILSQFTRKVIHVSLRTCHGSWIVRGLSIGDGRILPLSHWQMTPSWLLTQDDRSHQEEIDHIRNQGEEGKSGSGDTCNSFGSVVEFSRHLQVMMTGIWR